MGQDWGLGDWMIGSHPPIQSSNLPPITLVPGRDKQAVARALAAGRQALALDLRGAGEMRRGEGGN